MVDGPFLIFDDARPGGAAGRFYRKPVGEISAPSVQDVRPALQQLRVALAGGRHVAGFLRYEAGYALDPALADLDAGAAPLLWFGVFDSFEPVPTGPDPDGARIGKAKPRIERDAYLAAAAQVREHLFAGDFYQANLTFGCDVEVWGDPLAAYARLRAQALAGWGGVVRHPGGWILSLSPEQFFSIDDGLVEARPMKGTAPRRSDPVADTEEARNLASDPKQRAENLMIVDLLRNDLARISETGSIDVPQLFAVESYPTVHQMVSKVTARLRHGLNAVDVLETIFPCGSVTGAPKISAMRHLASLERVPRGAYTGSMGWIDPGGDAAFNVLIRTLELDNRAARAKLGLGSGLVVDSIAEDEWAECLLKGAFVNRAVEPVDLIETMRFDPEDGIVELDRHLQRLKDSAAELGFEFDRHAARNELQAATFGKKTLMKARLLLSPTGAMAIELKPIEEPSELPVPVTIRRLPVDASDPRLQRKTTDRRFYDEARLESGAFEVVFTDDDGFLTEGSFSSLFVEQDGRLSTPPLDRGVLPGILRAKLIAEGKAVERDVRPEDLQGGFFIGNMARGLLPARLA